MKILMEILDKIKWWWRRVIQQDDYAIYRHLTRKK